jgi:tetratricopeptide (TPR) repeat protein
MAHTSHPVRIGTLAIEVYSYVSVVGKWFSFGRNENYDEGIRLHQAGQYLDAIQQFKICLSSDPDPSTRERARSYMAGGLGKLARGEVALQNWTEALHYLDDAIALRPAFADLRILRAQVFRALKRDEDRMFEIRFALDLNPKYGFAILQDAILKLESGDREAGQARLREAVDADPRLDSDIYREAMALLQSGSEAESLSKLGLVVPVLKTDPEDIARAADQQAHEGRWHDAEEGYRRALEVAPRFADIRCKHGQVLLQIDELEQAVAEFREAVTINPRYADAYAFLGIAYRRLGQEDDALGAFRAALEVDPAHVIAAQEIERTR